MPGRYNGGSQTYALILYLGGKRSAEPLFIRPSIFLCEIPPSKDEEQLLNEHHMVCCVPKATRFL